MLAAISCDNLDDAIEQYKQQGYRLNMIKPADSPREALMSRGSESLRLLQKPARSKVVGDDKERPYSVRASATDEWVVGRVGMEYRDLVSDRMDGKMIASHIRLTQGGEVPDYVHYHKVEFQMIRCIKGRIKVVYEDQGEPFWLESGDWVIQPPEIRHRVMECSAGAEVIEISMPAEHETWLDHEMQLPNDVIDPERDFHGQRFVRFIAQKS